MNTWQMREQQRMNDGAYEPVNLRGDDPMRFLHVSLNDPGKVAYTLNDEKGEADIQTRTTLEKYCEKFGLEYTAPGDSGRRSSDAQDEFAIREMIAEYFGCLDRMKELKKQLCAVL